MFALLVAFAARRLDGWSNLRWLDRGWLRSFVWLVRLISSWSRCVARSLASFLFCLRRFFILVCSLAGGWDAADITTTGAAYFFTSGITWHTKRLIASRAFDGNGHGNVDLFRLDALIRNDTHMVPRGRYSDNEKGVGGGFRSGFR